MAHRGQNHNVDHTSSNPTPDELGQPADLAAQPRLGLLPEWGPGPGGSNPSSLVASRKNLKFLGSLSAKWRKRGGLHVHRLVRNFVACVGRWFPGVPHIGGFDTSFVAVRDHLASRASLPA